MLALAGLGCTTTGGGVGDTAHFKPLPKARLGEAPLDAVHPQSVTDLLRDAQDAFAAANVAHEEGDSAAALRHYSRMLALLAEADLDPAIYYSVREQFGSILDLSSQQAEVLALRRSDSQGAGRSDGLLEFGPVEVPFPLPEPVLEEIERIQNGYPKSFQAGLDRSGKYLPYIREELAKAGLPRELETVAMIESLFQPTVRSRAGAVGMWQFMNTSARRYGMRIDSEVDERRNWQRQTHAAIAYLKDLYAMFEGDWSLAVSAYNMGEGGLSRAIAANDGERDLWRLIETPPASNRIKDETKRYYPKFLASLIVASNPERYGFTVNPQAPDDLLRMEVKGPYLLAELDAAMGYTEGTLEQYNPELLQRMTPSLGSHRLAIPAQDHLRFTAALQKVDKLNQGGGTHRVRRGETISGIASRYRVSSRDLMRMNKISSPRKLRVGQNLMLPANGRGGPVVEAKNTVSDTVRTASVSTYTVRRGDTLYDIARSKGVSVSQLQAWNGLGRKTLKVGQKLDIRGGDTKAEVPKSATSPKPETAVRTASAGSSAGGTYYTVRSGDSPWKIAQANGVDLDELLQINRLSPNTTIKVGQKLLVKSGDAAGSSSATQTRYHKVVSGDTASTIAAKYGMKMSEFLAANGLNSRSILPVGKEYVVRGASVSPAEGMLASAKSPQHEKIEHTVSRGQNPTTIARRYGVRVSELFQWNDWSRNHVLQIGDKVVIHRR